MIGKHGTAKSTRGITFIGLLFVIFVIVFVAIIGIALVPPYLDHYAVKDSLESLAKDPGVKELSKEKLRDLFSRKLQVNYVTNVPVNKLEITNKDGKTALTIDYEIRVHLIANIDAVVKFNEEAFVE